VPVHIVAGYIESPGDLGCVDQALATLRALELDYLLGNRAHRVIV
jgi:hypothetical protein